jgi:hypothetical protein
MLTAMTDETASDVFQALAESGMFLSVPRGINPLK